MSNWMWEFGDTVRSNLHKSLSALPNTCVLDRGVLVNIIKATHFLRRQCLCTIAKSCWKSLQECQASSSIFWLHSPTTNLHPSHFHMLTPFTLVSKLCSLSPLPNTQQPNVFPLRVSTVVSLHLLWSWICHHSVNLNLSFNDLLTVVAKRWEHSDETSNLILHFFRVSC